MIFSFFTNLPHTPLTSIVSTQTLSPRVSFSLSNFSFFSLPPRSLTLRASTLRSSISFINSSTTSCCGLPSININAMADIVEDNKNALVDDADVNKHSRTFLDARSETDLLSGIKKELDAGRLSPTVAAGMEELFQNYKNAVLQSGSPKAEEIVISNMAAALDRILLDVEDPFVFKPHHKALREPFDYYHFGQTYIRPLIDFRNSYVGNLPIFKDMEEKLQQGHNIVLISNHQTEADPAAIALLLEARNPFIAENLIYVAGDRVVTDPLCKPFSMGRNLICVYSKKHMLDDPELVEMKKKANIRSLKEMAGLLRGGSQIVWIAPSGGRDRPDPATGEFYPAQFDSSSVDNMRRLADHSDAPGHIYPLALLCYDIMPPPAQVEKEIGEKRVVSFSGVGLSVAAEIKFSEIATAYSNPEEAKEAYSQALYHSVTEQYNVLKSAVLGKQGLEVSTPNVILSQPWNLST